jgi:primosomal protein N' (replication factor Y)
VGYVVGAGVPPPAGTSTRRASARCSTSSRPSPSSPTTSCAFLREAADYYLHPLGEVLRTAAPAIARRAADDDPREPTGRAKKSALKARWSRVREEVYVRLVDPDAPLPKLRGDKQAQVVSILAARVEVSMRELRSQLKNPRAAVDALVQRGLVVLEAREVPDDPFFGAPVPRDEPPPLRPAQADAVSAVVGTLQRRERATFLLYGVTGSGKTEVYLRAMAAAQAKIAGALLLLPEIALTPQLVSRYRARFGDDLAVLHSGLKDADRHAMWRKLRKGECRVAIGARSAVFAPVPTSGSCSSTRSTTRPSSRTTTSATTGATSPSCARTAPAPCACSAARRPRVESYFAAMEGRYQLLHLPDRATRAELPSIEIVDLKRVGARGPTGHELLSLPLVRGIGDASPARSR